MSAVVYLFQMRDGYFGVDACCIEATVAEKLLDEADVRAVFEHVGGAGVPHQVAAAGFSDLGLFHCFSHPVAQINRAQAFAVATEEEGLLGVV